MSPLLETYDIHSILDLYNLIMFGNEDHCSMFEALKTESWIAEHLILPEHKWQWYLDYSKKRLIDTGSVIRGFQLFVAVFLNVHIVLHPNTEKYTDTKALTRANEEARQLRTAMQRITDPIETIDISLEPTHVEYLPRPEEDCRCEAIRKQLMREHFCADEMQATQERMPNECVLFEELLIGNLEVFLKDMYKRTN